MASIIFYILGFTLLAATLLSITRRNPVHAVIFLVNGLFALALMFYMLGAPLVAAWEVIVYAGAIMVLFLFIIMVLGLAPKEVPEMPDWQRWLPAVLLSAVILGCTLLLVLQDGSLPSNLEPYHATPRELGEALFGRYALAVKIVSFQLLYATIGAYYLGRHEPRRQQREESS